MSSSYNRWHTFGLKFIHMRWKLLSVLCPLPSKPATEMCWYPWSQPSSPFCYLSWQRRSSCWTPGPPHPSPHLICDLVQSSTDFSFVDADTSISSPVLPLQGHLEFFFPQGLERISHGFLSAASDERICDDNESPWPSPLTSTPELCWDILRVWETLQHSKTAHSSLEPKGCWLKVVRLP